MPATTHPQALRYRVSGMDCASCAAKIETALGRMDDVSEIAVSADWVCPGQVDTNDAFA